MSAKEEAVLEIINELTLHIEKLEMDNEINIIRDNLNKEIYENADNHILDLKNILGKLIEKNQLTSSEIEKLKTAVKDKSLLEKL